MPILHSQLSAQSPGPDGSPVQISPQLVLLNRGPVLQITVGLAQSMAQPLLQQGITLPTPLSGLALIDTGASVTCIDEAAAQQLQLPVVGTTQMVSASHANVQQNIYPVQIELVGANITIESPQTMAAALAAQGLLMLIGRDVLANCTLFYNGPTGQITLSL